MKHLYFIRSNTGIDWDMYYDLKTEVVIFGDAEGYEYFADSLQKAETAEKNLHLDEIKRDSNGMRGVIVPAVPIYKTARLRIIERPVFAGGRHNMELVIIGNRLGYQGLAASFREFAAAAKNTKVGDEQDCFDDHEHWEDWGAALGNSRLVKRSVSLNIRAPVPRWKKGKMGGWECVVYERGENYFPKDLDYKLKYPPEPYAEFETEELAKGFLRGKTYG